MLLRTLRPTLSGTELSSLQWLLDHHSTKESERRQMVRDLDLQQGDRILDLGCGPGLWASMFAEEVAPTGEVVGMDFAPDLIEHAMSRVKSDPNGDAIRYVVGSFYKIPFLDRTFDAIFLGNCCSYVSDVVGLLNEMKRVTKPGGRLISKEFDDGATIFHPIDPHLNARVIAGVSAAQGDHSGELRLNGKSQRRRDRDAAEPASPRFNSFMGRKMHGFFGAAGLTQTSVKAYAIQKVPPLTPEAKNYLEGLARWLGATAAPFLADEESQRWEAAFDSNGSQYILDRDDFYVCMIEVMTTGVVR